MFLLSIGRLPPMGVSACRPQHRHLFLESQRCLEMMPVADPRHDDIVSDPTTVFPEDASLLQAPSATQFENMELIMCRASIPLFPDLSFPSAPGLKRANSSHGTGLLR